MERIKDPTLSQLHERVNNRAEKGMWPSEIPEWDAFVTLLKKETKAIAVIVCGINNKPTQSMRVEIIHHHDGPYQGGEDRVTPLKQWSKMISYTSLLT